MRAFFSHYRLRYIRSLIYMLQATEYSLGDYIIWYRRTIDFSRVEKRRQLVQTTKTKLLMLALWLLAVLALLYVLWLVWSGLKVGGYLGTLYYLLAFLTIYILPEALAYLVMLPLWFGQTFVQGPLTVYKVRQAKAKLKKHPALKIAIAGSYGKTTTKEILQTILSHGKKVAATPANMNTELAISRFIMGLDGKENVVIFELGEYRPGDIKRYCRLTMPDMGIITGVNEAHLVNFGNLKVTASNIFSLADYLDDEPVYVNGDDPMARQYSKANHKLYSWEGVNGWKVVEAKTDLTGTAFTLKRGETVFKAKTKLIGLHQLGPLIVAIDIADQIGLSMSQIKKGISLTKPFEHRLQPQTRAGGVVVIDDTYNGNPTGVKVALEFLRGLKIGRKLYVTPGLVEAGAKVEPVHRQIGHELAESVDVVILIRNSVTPYIYEGLKEKNFKGEIIWFDDALECYASIDNLTRAGDVVLMQNDWPDQYA